MVAFARAEHLQDHAAHLRQLPPLHRETARLGDFGVYLGTGGLEDRLAAVMPVDEQEPAEALLREAFDRLGDQRKHRGGFERDRAREGAVQLGNTEGDGRRHHRVPLLTELVRQLFGDDQVRAQWTGRAVLLGTAEGHDDVGPSLEILVHVLPEGELEKHAAESTPDSARPRRAPRGWSAQTGTSLSLDAARP